MIGTSESAGHVLMQNDEMATYMRESCACACERSQASASIRRYVKKDGNNTGTTQQPTCNSPTNEARVSDSTQTVLLLQQC